ncbi:MAG: hypothetical protein G01um101491_407 [Parcubacteria group bacterium Gr01-1014_91]|nr:MAG: hypothetical protein G01um101491_407 [Parcubacteria group bacterium Gr01-1014_91]
MKSLLIAVALLVGLAGCATTHRTTTVQTTGGQTVTTEEFDYIGYSTPIVVTAYPGVAFYPRYVVGCGCIWPVAFIGGVWVNHHGAHVTYHGHWTAPPRHVREVHIREYRANPHRPEFRRAPPGHFNRPHQSPPPQHVRPLPKPPQVQRQQPQVQQKAPQEKPQQHRREPAKKQDKKQQ